jgi:ornithine cyclodeaminase
MAEAPPYITAGDVEGQLNWLAVAEALAAGHRAARPAIGDQFLTRGADTLVTRAAWIDGMGGAVKAFSVMAGNPARGLPSVQGTLMLFDDATGAVRAVIDSELVTKWKTAGDSILGARLLARPGSRRLLILGAGAVAASLVEAYRAAFPAIEVTVWSRSPEGARALAARTGATVAPDLEAAVAEADIVATATMATRPVLQGAWLRPGQHVDLIGAFRADMREADDDAIRKGRLFVDSFETTLAHIGELKDPLERGVIARADVLGDLHDLVAGRAGRRSDDEITVFKNGGGAHLDLMTGWTIFAAWERAKS